MKRFTATHAVDALTIVALIISFSKLVDLALRAGYWEPIAVAWPLIIDGLALIAHRASRSLTGWRRVYAWLLLLGATCVSIVAAGASALLPQGALPPLAAAIVFALPPVCLLAAQHLAHLMRDEHRDAPTATVVATRPANATPHPTRAMEPADAPRRAAAPRRTHADDAVSPATAVTHPAMTQQDPDDAPTRPTPTRTAVTHQEEPAPAANDAPDAVLFDLTRDASARRARRGAVTPEQRAEVLRLAATTTMSGRDIGDAAGTSEPSVRRILRDVGGRDALRADAAPALATG